MLAPIPTIGHKVKQGPRHKIYITSRTSRGKQRKHTVTDFRGVIVTIISSAFDSHFVSATGDRLLFTLQNRDGGRRGDEVRYRGWVKWNGAIWITCETPTEMNSLLPKRRSRKKNIQERGLFDDE